MESRLQFPDSYFEDEVRDGYYVPGMMKRSWAAQMEVLAEVDAVCRKHGLQYFADAGTLLGAIRHKGFIPWDDDLDICMKRADYNRFIHIAQEELPEGYVVVSVYTMLECEIHLCHVINTDTVSFQAEHLQKYHGFPYIAGLDIFVLDDVMPDKDAEAARQDLVKYVNHVVKTMEDMDEKTLELHLRTIDQIAEKPIDRKGHLKNQLRLVLEKLFTAGEDYDAKELAIMGEWIFTGANRFDREWYRAVRWIPFENMEIPVPVVYDAVLRSKYGEYMHIHKNGGLHNYPYYRSFEEQVKRETGWEMTPKYTVSKEELQKASASGEKSGKEQALELGAWMAKGHTAVREAIQAGDLGQVLELLEACQKAAITMGALIEQLEGEGFVTVGMLEAYCEEVYEIYNGLVQGVGAEPENMYSRLDGHLGCIRKSVEQDVRKRREVVFLPYKASAWGSLESVWRAAMEDPDCDVYVIPIPYYYKRPDRSLGRMCYEGDQYPEDVPVTWYEDYDFAKRRPDMVFIHNPYDEYNHTTSVHPFFYAQNLKKFTEQLVYIPWFTLDEIGPEDERGQQSMDYFVTVPGVVYADKVIVQSEQMRQSYIDCLCRAAGEDTRAVWEKKILGLGSPLADKETGGRQGDRPAVLEEWQKVLKRPDGSRKKVFLYYTSSSMLLQHREKMLKKLEIVLKQFEEQQQEIALLWKPEPLSREVLRSMKLPLRKAYEEIVQRYRTDGWGIYDDTEDARRVVELCDAYYGDGGSLLQLCRRAGKPVMLQNVEV